MIKQQLKKNLLIKWLNIYIFVMSQLVCLLRDIFFIFNINLLFNVLLFDNIQY